MSNTKTDFEKILDYAAITGSFTAVVRELLLNKSPNKTFCAKLIVEMSEKEGTANSVVLRLANDLKKEYNL